MKLLGMDKFIMALTHHKSKEMRDSDQSKVWFGIVAVSLIGFAGVLAFTGLFFYKINYADDVLVEQNQKFESKGIKIELLKATNEFYDAREASSTFERIGSSVPVDPAQ